MPVRKRLQLGRISEEMGILGLNADERVAGVNFLADSLSVTLRDGRVICAPLAWYPKAAPCRSGTTQQLEDRRWWLWHLLARPRRRSEYRGPSTRVACIPTSCNPLRHPPFLAHSV